MTEFVVRLTEEAKADIRRLNHPERDRVLKKLEWLGINASFVIHQPLKGERWRGIYKYRLGDYRILYLLDVDQRQITILKVGHRRDVYKG